MRRLLLALCAVCATTACDEKKGEAEEIPESIRGSYGRDAMDLFVDTLGLEVDKDVLRFSEMRVKIIAGKMVGSTYQIDEAEVTWAKQDKLPNKCKGTLARQGNRLLISMFKKEVDETCEAALKGEWTAWSPTTSFPKPMVGTFGIGGLYGMSTSVDVTPEAMKFGPEKALIIEQGVVFDERPQSLLIRKAKWGDAECKGSIDLEDDKLKLRLEPLGEEEFPPRCPAMTLEPWTIDEAILPHKSIDNGKVRLKVDGSTLEINTLDEQGLRCAQKILRTGVRASTDSGRDRIPVGAGAVLVLEHTAPSGGTSACDDRLRNLAANQCEDLFGGPCEEQLLDGFHGGGAEGLMCPTHVVIGEPTTKGRKVALLPHSIPNAVCFEMAGDFTGG